MLLLRVPANAVALWVAIGLVAGVTLKLHSGDILNGWVTLSEGLLAILVTAVVFTLVNWIVLPIVKLLALPLRILTLGLFGLVINAGMLMLTDKITDLLGYGIEVDGFWTALWAAIIIAVVNWVIDLVIGAVSADSE